MAGKAGNVMLTGLLYGAEVGTLAFLAWRNHLHAAVITILAVGIVLTWFLPRNFTMLAIGLALLACAVTNQVLNIRSEIGYTAAVLTTVVGAVVAMMEK